MPSYDSELALALRLADTAAEIALRYFHSGALGTTIKPDGSPVTAADTEIEQALREEIARAHPRDAFLGEESGLTGDGPRMWTVDPIDGTASFASRGDEWSTLIALVDEGVPVVGVVTRTPRGDRWWAAQDRGAFKNGTQIHASPTERLADAVMLEDFRISTSRKLDWNPVGKLARACRAVKPFHEVFDLFGITDGTVDLSLLWYSGTGPDLDPWVCILNEAGGRHSDLNGISDVHEPVQLASNGGVHDEVLDLINAWIADGEFDPSIRPVEDISAIMDARARQPNDLYTVR
jgi:histidinol-phosphatase